MKHLTTRLLFDTGSQRTYINVKLQNLLNLKTIRKEKIVIKTFGQTFDFQTKILDVVQLKIKHRFDDKFLFIEALVVPEICSPLKAQNISVAQKEYDVISN